MAAPQLRITAAELVRSVKTDLGAIVRRSEAETLTQDEFRSLTSRMRRCLNQLAIEVDEPDAPDRVELTDLGAAIGRLADAGVIGPHRELLAGVPETGRLHRHLVALDGGARPETPLKGA